MDNWDKIVKQLFEPYFFNVVTNQINISQKVKVEKGCNSFQVTNLGTSVIRVNKITLFPSATPATVAGDSITFGGNLGEIYKGDINITFVLPVGATPLAEISQKFYIGFES